jgi:hypothetical protein
MTNATIQTSRDWLGKTRTTLLGWWIPLITIPAGLAAPVSVRAIIWTIALVWMGTACILNARRCNRTHCRYTGPYYLVMIVPVIALGTGAVSAGIYGWFSLGVFILVGSKWGKFS